MNKNHIIIEDYDFIDDELYVYFSINLELEVREGKISIDEVDQGLDSEGLYNMSSDHWNGRSESHYTEDWTIGFDEYVSEHITSDNIRDFIYDYYGDKPLPNILTDEDTINIIR